MLIGKLAKWLVLLTEFDIQYLTKKTIKGRAVAEFLALNPIEGFIRFETFSRKLFCRASLSSQKNKPPYIAR